MSRLTHLGRKATTTAALAAAAFLVAPMMFNDQAKAAGVADGCPTATISATAFGLPPLNNVGDTATIGAITATSASGSMTALDTGDLNEHVLATVTTDLSTGERQLVAIIQAAILGTPIIDQGMALGVSIDLGGTMALPTLQDGWRDSAAVGYMPETDKVASSTGNNGKMPEVDKVASALVDIGGFEKNEIVATQLMTPGGSPITAMAPDSGLHGPGGAPATMAFGSESVA